MLSRRLIILQGLSKRIVCKNAITSTSCLLSIKDDSTVKRLPLLTMYTKEDCSLCDIAKEKLDQYKEMFIFEAVDITLPENEKWFDKYKYDIPVFHLDGKYLMRHKVHEGTLLKSLKEYENINK